MTTQTRPTFRKGEELAEWINDSPRAYARRSKCGAYWRAELPNGEYISWPDRPLGPRSRRFLVRALAAAGMLLMVLSWLAGVV